MTGPTVVEFVLGGLSFDLVVLLVLGVGAVLAWIVFGGLLAAALEVEGIRIVATDDDVVAPSRAMDDAARAAWDARSPRRRPHAFDPSRQALRDRRRPDGDALPAHRRDRSGPPPGSWP